MENDGKCKTVRLKENGHDTRDSQQFDKVFKMITNKRPPSAVVSTKKMKNKS